MSLEYVRLSHGSGAGNAELLHEVILPALGRDEKGRVLEDAAVEPAPDGRIAFSTDSFVIYPRTFPGGDLGKLAACGTINDLAMMAAKPLYLSVSLICEEGLAAEELRKHVASLRAVCDACGVRILCGDTKVVEKGKADGLFITTCGIGIVMPEYTLSAANAQPGDSVLVSGPIGRHGITVLSQRKALNFKVDLKSDCAPLWEPAERVLKAAPQARVLRDATRGGVAAVLNEIAETSAVCVRLRKRDIPVDTAVASACDFLGMEPVQIANEGTFVAIVPSSQEPAALEALRGYDPCAQAACIGTVEQKGRFSVVMETEIGGLRPVETPPGELLPRIC
jgi:hydrogenase expression/formation protein HypE